MCTVSENAGPSIKFNLTIATQSAAAVAVVRYSAILAESAVAEVTERHVVGSALGCSSAVQLGVPSPAQAR